MGGSLAMAAREAKLFAEIIGADNSEANLKTACELKIIDRALSEADLIAISDLIVLAAPVEAIKAITPRLVGAKNSAVFTDLGSVKSAIIAAIPAEIRDRYVAAHPMCGTEYSGPKAAFATLYKDRIAVLCDSEKNSLNALRKVENLFLSIGMRIVKMPARDHDRHAAFISHLPHAISYALANSVLSQEDKGSILTLAAGGFRDMSRLAKSAPSMWLDIFKQNREPLLQAFKIFTAEMASLEDDLKNGEWESLESAMKNANALHQIFN
jgi:prephenate dehydrogenase